MVTKGIRNRLAAAVALAGLGLAAPAMATPLAPDAGLRQSSGDALAIQYGYGDHHHGWSRPGFRHGDGRGYGDHHGFGRGHGHHHGWRHYGYGHHRHGDHGRHHGPR